METTQQVIAVNDKLIKLAQIDTRSAILEACRNLEESLKEAVLHKCGSPIPNLTSSYNVVKEAENMKLLSPKEFMIVNDLRGLRNQAAHIRKFNPSQESAYKYIELSKSIESSARKVALRDISITPKPKETKGISFNSLKFDWNLILSSSSNLTPYKLFPRLRPDKTMRDATMKI